MHKGRSVQKPLVTPGLAHQSWALGTVTYPCYLVLASDTHSFLCLLRSCDPTSTSPSSAISVARICPPGALLSGCRLTSLKPCVSGCCGEVGKLLAGTFQNQPQVASASLEGRGENYGSHISGSKSSFLQTLFSPPLLNASTGSGPRDSAASKTARARISWGFRSGGRDTR